MKRTQWLIVLAALAVGVTGCGDDDGRMVDGGVTDGGRDGGRDSGTDSGTDANVGDDSGMDDAGPDDAGPDDAGMDDGGMDDAGTDGGMVVEGIAAVRAATPGALSPAIAVEDVIVTYARPVIGSDPVGFFVQAAAAGPALFVAIDPATLTPALAVGDTVSFEVTTTALVSGMLHVTAIDALSRSATGADVATLVQDVSAATDLVSATGDYESEYVFAEVTLAGADVFSGGGHRAYPVDTTGISGNADLQLRVPDAFIADLALEPGCVVAVGPSPLWRFANATTNRAQLMGYRESDLVVTSCPLPEVVEATATTPATVVVTFSRPLDPATVGVEDFVFTGGAGLTPSAVMVSADGRSVTVTVGAMTNGTTYTVTVTGVEDAITGDGIDVAANTAMFEALGPELMPMEGEIVFTEIMANPSGPEPAAEWLELYNRGTEARQLVGCRLTGGIAADLLTFGNVVVPAGEYLVIGGAESEATPDIALPFGLTNGGETLTLTCGATTIDTVSFDNASPWPSDVGGSAIQLSADLYDGDNSVGTSWCHATATFGTRGDFGTPGAVNGTCTPVVVEPTVVSATATDATTVNVVFSAAMDPATVMFGDFAFTGGLTASAVTLSGDGLTATVTTSAQTEGMAYTVTVTGVSDTMGTAIDATANTAMFTGFTAAGAGVLIISEYVEGGSNNKALEITNVGAASMSLMGCQIRTYNNAAGTPGSAYNLPDMMLAADESFVVCNTGSNATLMALCDATSNNATGFSGDDAVELLCAGATVDVIGVFGTREVWGAGTDFATQNRTLRRKCTVTAGDTTGTDAFDPSVEWDGFAQDTFDGLGAHCP